jgi:hypothetical protein
MDNREPLHKSFLVFVVIVAFALMVLGYVIFPEPP